MTERHIPPRDPHLEALVQWHPFGGSPERVGAGRAVEAIIIETNGPIGSGDPGGH